MVAATPPPPTTTTTKTTKTTTTATTTTTTMTATSSFWTRTSFRLSILNFQDLMQLMMKMMMIRDTER